MNVKVILVNLGELALNVPIYHYIIKPIKKIYQQYFKRSSIILMLMGKCNFTLYTVVLIYSFVIDVMVYTWLQYMQRFSLLLY